MDNAQSLFRDGKLEELHRAVAADVRQNPQDASARALMVQVLCCEGAWERAATQAAALMKLDPGSALFCTSVQDAAAAEQERERVLSGRTAPCWLGEAPAYADAWRRAAAHYAAGRFAEAAAETEAVLDALPCIPVALSGGVHAPWLLDGDARFAGVMEWMRGGRYHLVALPQVASVELPAPRLPVEAVWVHARITLRDGSSHIGRMPARYPFTPGQESPENLLARSTEWQEVTPGFCLGRGLRGWDTPEGIIPLFSEHMLRFGTPTE